jgi:hypothetical protein
MYFFRFAEIENLSDKYYLGWKTEKIIDEK